jgi:hypothetical protein
MTLSATDLIGAWRLISVIEVFDDGERRPEFGPNADGYLSYSPNGIVSAVLGSIDRTNSTSADPQGASDSELAAMARPFIAYAGPFTIAPGTDTVTHHVDVALFANWQTGAQVRHVLVERDRLVITASPRTGADGRTFHSELTWGRIPSP